MKTHCSSFLVASGPALCSVLCALCFLSSGPSPTLLALISSVPSRRLSQADS